MGRLLDIAKAALAKPEAQENRQAEPREAESTSPRWTEADLDSGEAGLVPLECYACHGRLFWRSIYGAVICYTCHAPGSEGLVTDLIWHGQVKWSQ